jgi:RNA polymerase sigma-70 factor (sigma-E family)
VTTTLTTSSGSPDGRLEFPDYVARRRPALLRAARAIAGDASSAEDLLQCALVRVLPHWSTIREPRAIDAYIRRAMRNQHASWYRQKWRSRERSFAQVPDLTSSSEGRPGNDAVLWPLVAALPPAQRSAVALRYYEGLSINEVAQALGCSPGTVKSNTSRALASLRLRIAEGDDDITSPYDDLHPQARTARQALPCSS